MTVPRARTELDPPFFLNAVPWGGQDVPWLSTVSLQSITAVDRGDEPEYVLASSLLWEPSWTLTAMPVLSSARSGVLLCSFYNRPEASDEERLLRTAFPRLVIESPKVPLFGSNHSKFLLAFHARRLRIIIASGNFIQRDYERKTQTLFVHDCPAVATPVPCDFATQLRAYIHHLKKEGGCFVDEALKRLHGYDMSGIRARLVTSVPGSNSTGAHGHMRLRQLLRNRSAEACAHHLVMQCSSFKANVTEPWLAELSSSLCSHSAGTVEAAASVAVPAAGMPRKRMRDDAAGVVAPAPTARIQFVWPTSEMVRWSVEGWEGGASLPAQGHYFNESVVSRLHVYQGLGHRVHSVPHLKTLLEYRVEVDEGGGSLIAIPWIYTGSHNMSAASLGTLTKHGTSLTLLSYEMGLLFLPEDFTPRGGADHSSGMSASAAALPRSCLFTPASARISGPFSVRCDDGSLRCIVPVPLPYALPPRRYDPADKPFAVNVPFDGVDSAGRAALRAGGE